VILTTGKTEDIVRKDQPITPKDNVQNGVVVSDDRGRRKWRQRCDISLRKHHPLRIESPTPFRGDIREEWGGPRARALLT
jgi:hypothetical protein